MKYSSPHTSTEFTGVAVAGVLQGGYYGIRIFTPKEVYGPSPLFGQSPLPITQRTGKYPFPFLQVREANKDRIVVLPFEDMEGAFQSSEQFRALEAINNDSSL